MPNRSVLHVLEALEGGTARHLVDLVTHVDGWEHHAAIPVVRAGALTDRQAAGRLSRARAEVHTIAMSRAPLRGSNAAALGQLVGLMRRIQPAIVHGHSSIGGALGRTAALVTGRPRVYTANGLADSRAAFTVERALGRFTDRFVATSPSEAALVLDKRLVPASRLRTIPNGIEIDPPLPGPDLRTRLGLARESSLVGSVARLVPQKAPERLVAAASRLVPRRPDVHFLLIGGGPMFSELEAAVVEAGLTGRFHLLGDLPDAAGVLDQLDVFVSTSRFEGAPYAPLEALRAGTPVVLTDVVGNRDVVVDGVSGYLVGEDAAIIAERVWTLLAEPARCRAIAAAGRVRVVERFDVKVMGASLANLYDELNGG